jgi:hypothetical protein
VLHQIWEKDVCRLACMSMAPTMHLTFPCLVFPIWILWCS